MHVLRGFLNLSARASFQYHLHSAAANVNGNAAQSRAPASATHPTSCEAVNGKLDFSCGKRNDDAMVAWSSSGATHSHTHSHKQTHTRTHARTHAHRDTQVWLARASIGLRAAGCAHIRTEVLVCVGLVWLGDHTAYFASDGHHYHVQHTADVVRPRQGAHLADGVCTYLCSG